MTAGSAGPAKLGKRYPTESDRQAALDENQQRPGEWGFYAAAARSPRQELSLYEN